MGGERRITFLGARRALVITFLAALTAGLALGVTARPEPAAGNTVTPELSLTGQGLDCDTNPNTPIDDECTVVVGAQFTVEISLDKIAGLGPSGAWIGIQARVLNSPPLTLNPRGPGFGFPPEAVNCPIPGGIAAASGGDGDFTVACATGIGDLPRTDTGVMFEFDYICNSLGMGSLTMPNGPPPDSAIYNIDNQTVPDGNELDILNVNCIPFIWDVNVDGYVSVGDIGLVVAFFGQTVPPAPAPTDVNGDGAVSIGDIGEVVAHFGEQEP